MQTEDADEVCFISSSAEDPLQHLSETTSTSLFPFFFFSPGGKAWYVILCPDFPATRRGTAPLAGKTQEQFFKYSPYQEAWWKHCCL